MKFTKKNVFVLFQHKHKILAMSNYRGNNLIIALILYNKYKNQ